MKFVALILSIYFLTLNFVPCEDNDAVGNEIKTEISHQSNGNHTDFDLCSPFCQCHCCHINVTHFKVGDYSILNSLISTQEFHYFKGLENDFNNTILQPPRV